MAIHPSILAWKIPWTEECGGLQSMRLQRVRQDSVTKQQQIDKKALSLTPPPCPFSSHFLFDIFPLTSRSNHLSIHERLSLGFLLTEAAAARS